MYVKYLVFKENRAARVWERERLGLDKQIERIKDITFDEV
jgi:hypothetical protein